MRSNKSDENGENETARGPTRRSFGVSRLGSPCVLYWKLIGRELIVAFTLHRAVSNSFTVSRALPITFFSGPFVVPTILS